MRQSLLVVGGAVVLLVGAAYQFSRQQPGTKLGLAAAQPLRFRFIAPCVNEAFFNPVKRGMRDAASMLGVQCEFVGTEDVDIPAQAALVRQAVSDGCDGIALAIIDPTGFDAVIQDAQSKRVPVIAFNVDDNSTPNARLSAVCQNLYKAGRTAGETAIPLIPAGSKILMPRHSQGISALEDRLRGMQEVLGSKGVTWEVLTTGTTPAAAQEAVTRFLQTHPEIRWILCTGLADTEGAGLAVEKQFQLRGCWVGGFDLSAEVLRLLKAGIIRFAVDQQPYLQGFYPVVQLTHYCRYGLKPSNIDVGAKVLGPQDANTVIEYSRKGYRQNNVPTDRAYATIDLDLQNSNRPLVAARLGGGEQPARGASLRQDAVRHAGEPACELAHLLTGALGGNGTWRSERRLFLERRYHLHYIYENRVGVSWAHVSSKDMMHWQWPAVHAPRGLSTADFYADWAQANFGNEDSYDLAAGKKKDRACRREFKMRLVVGTK